MEPTLLCESDSYIIVDKPSGLSVHAAENREHPTLIPWLLTRYPDIAEVGEDPARPGIVHRLDRETSGVLVIARTQHAFDLLKRQFKEREIKKTYRAFVYGSLKHERGVIDRPIGSARNGRAPRSATHAYGKVRDAVTAYRRIESSSEASYVEIFPKTGRTHQIRVHFSAIQHPVICDQLYAHNRPPLLGFSRLALHAFSLSFAEPGTGKEVSFVAPLPEDFIEAEKKLRSI